MALHKKLWHRKYNGQITLVPGIRRNVVDEFGSVQGYYEYAGINEFHIVTEKVTACAKVFEDGWKVFVGSDVVAEFFRLADSSRNQFEEDGYDMEEMFQVDIPEGTDCSLYPYIMAIPMLGF